MAPQLPDERKLKTEGTSKKKSCNISLTEEDKLMLQGGGSLTNEELRYIKNLLASGVANTLVGRVTQRMAQSTKQTEKDSFLEFDRTEALQV